MLYWQAPTEPLEYHIPTTSQRWQPGHPRGWFLEYRWQFWPTDILASWLFVWWNVLLIFSWISSTPYILFKKKRPFRPCIPDWAQSVDNFNSILSKLAFPKLRKLYPKFASKADLKWPWRLFVPTAGLPFLNCAEISCTTPTALFFWSYLTTKSNDSLIMLYFLVCISRLP